MTQTNALETLRSGSGFFLIAGPCAIESEEIVLNTGRHIKEVCSRLGISFALKGSYRKANRSRLDSFSGIGDLEALKILADAGRELGVPVVTDIHEPGAAAMAAEFADILQIPAFLCRQTDLLVAAAHTGKPVNIKKGQFMAPEAMRFAAEKVRTAGNNDVMVTERGTTFGYGDLVVDFRGVPRMQQACRCPVIVDCTHSLQQPNTAGGVTGGCPEMIETIARAAVATGADGLFIETHPEPARALSDGANMLRLDLLEPLLSRLAAIRRTIDSFTE